MITSYFNKLLDEHLNTNNIALGNHMFQYSLCRLIAHNNGYNFYIPYPGFLKECFPDIDLGIKDGEILNFFHEDEEQNYNPGIFSVPDFTHLVGYFQSEKYFKGNEDLVKSWFNFEMDDLTKSTLDRYSIDSYCYVHIRGGDNKYNGTNWLIPRDYYLKAFQKIQEIKKDISFVIITDDIEFSKHYFPDIDVISNNIMSDFKCLYYSKYSIISASTFSWWPAWLSEKKIVVAPKNWLNYNSRDKDYFFPADIKTEKFLYV
jgi:hypothetical protein